MNDKKSQILLELERLLAASEALSSEIDAAPSVEEKFAIVTTRGLANSAQIETAMSELRSLNLSGIREEIQQALESRGHGSKLLKNAGREAATLLETAEAEGVELRDMAAREAAELVETARAEAAEIISDAENAARDLEESARQEAADLLEEAIDEARELLEEAEDQAAG